MESVSTTVAHTFECTGLFGETDKEGRELQTDRQTHREGQERIFGKVSGTSLPVS